MINGLRLENVDPNDNKVYYKIKKLTCEKYVIKYFGSWNEEEQIEYNNKIFNESLNQTFFKSVILNDKIVGFFGYSIFDDKIGCVTLQIVNVVERIKIFTQLLCELMHLSNKLNLPIFAKTFLDCKDIELYKKAGFEIIEETSSHYHLVRYSKGEMLND